MDEKAKARYEKEVKRIVSHVTRELNTTTDTLNIVRDINSLKERGNKYLVETIKLENKINKILDYIEELKQLAPECEYDPIEENYDEEEDKCENCERNYACTMQIINKILDV